MFHILEKSGLWGYFAQEDIHYTAEGVGIIAAICHQQPLDKKVQRLKTDFLPLGKCAQITPN